MTALRLSEMAAEAAYQSGNTEDVFSLTFRQHLLHENGVERPRIAVQFTQQFIPNASFLEMLRTSVILLATDLVDEF